MGNDKVYDRRVPLKTFIFTSFAFLVIISSPAQIQQAWVAKYNNGITNGNHQAVKMALDSAGNIYVTGFSQNTNGNLDYATIKYAPNGNQVWASRFDSTNTTTAKPANLVLDSQGDVIVTGSAITVKYNTNGNQLWTAPYAGAALAVDLSGNICVTGYSTDLGTVKLSPSGSNIWTVNYPDIGQPNVGQAVAIDTNGNVYVAGSDTWDLYYLDGYPEVYVRLDLFKYDSNGNQIWLVNYVNSSDSSVLLEAISIVNSGNIYLEAGFFGSHPNTCLTLKYGNGGSLVWSSFYETHGNFSLAHGLAVDNMGNVVVTGDNAYQYPNTQYGTYKLNTNGTCTFTNLYPTVASGVSVSTSTAVDPADNVYITGCSPGSNSGEDIVTIKYDNNGNMIWLQRYNGLGNGDDEGNAIAVDANGNVYVTGYETVAGGGTEMVTIKYAPGPLLQKQSNGSILLQAVGAAGQNFDIQASTNLQTWQDLGTNTADTNGAVQFTDTNAPLFDRRFYLTIPQ